MSTQSNAREVASDDIAQTDTELVFFHLAHDVRPEIPENSLGREIMGIFKSCKTMAGYISSAWGRTEEDPNALVWAIEWTDSRATAPLEELRRIALPDPAVVSIRTRLTPSLGSIGGIAAAPIADITTLTFPLGGGQVPEDDMAIKEAVLGMQKGVMGALPLQLTPSYFCRSTWESRPVVKNLNDPAMGESILSVVVVGWQSTKQHYDIWEHNDFRKTYILPVKNRMAPYPPGLGMKHIPFQRVE